MVLVNWCGRCKKDEESIDHLFLHCESAQFLWNSFFNRFGLAWAMPRGVAHLLSSWWSWGRPRNAVVWKIIPLYIMWCLWSERNERFGLTLLSYYSFHLDRSLACPLSD
jgi:hypothetical protein